MKRYLIDVYEVDIPQNGVTRDDMSESTEDWLEKLGRVQCFRYQLQGSSLPEIAEILKRSS